MKRILKSGHLDSKLKGGRQYQHIRAKREELNELEHRGCVPRSLIKQIVEEEAEKINIRLTAKAAELNELEARLNHKQQELDSKITLLNIQAAAASLEPIQIFKDGS